MPRLLEAPWHTTAPLVPMLCEPEPPNSTRLDLMLVQASARTKASLVLMVCETGALEAQACAWTARDTLAHQGRTAADVVPARCHQQHKA